jgi:hypothetical protein
MLAQLGKSKTREIASSSLLLTEKASDDDGIPDSLFIFYAEK